MILSGAALSAQPATGWSRRLVPGVVVMLLLVVGVLAFRPDLRGYVGYRLKANTGTPAVIATAVPPPRGDGPPIRLATAGDVGTGGSDEYRTAEAMDRLEGSAGYDALLLLGDNVYPSGDPTQVRQKVLDPFAAVLDAPTRLLPVLGNHDVENGNGDAQAAALGMPGRWYSRAIGDTLVLSLDSTRPDDPEQAAWLADTLVASDATWKIATLHHPAYSGGYHGSSRDVRDAFSVAAWAELHFVDIGVWPDRMEVRAIDQDGNVFDEVALSAVPPVASQ